MAVFLGVGAKRVLTRRVPLAVLLPKVRGHVPVARIAALRTLNGALEVICPMLSSCKSLQPRQETVALRLSALKVWAQSVALLPFLAREKRVFLSEQCRSEVSGC